MERNKAFAKCRFKRVQWQSHLAQTQTTKQEHYITQIFTVQYNLCKDKHFAHSIKVYQALLRTYNLLPFKYIYQNQGTQFQLHSSFASWLLSCQKISANHKDAMTELIIQYNIPLSFPNIVLYCQNFLLKHEINQFLNSHFMRFSNHKGKILSFQNTFLLRIFEGNYLTDSFQIEKDTEEKIVH